MHARRRFTSSEELANSISHGIGALFGFTALILMLIFASSNGNSWHTVSMSIYGSTLVILFLSSTLVHSCKPGKTQEFFHKLDLIAIYLLIAGTYTPLALVSLKNDWGWVLFGIEWGLAFTGVSAKIFLSNKFERSVNYFTIISYLIMGWLLLLFLFPIFRNVPMPAIILVFMGGGLYSLGIVFYKMGKVKYHHLVWHIFVLAGSVTHFIAIFRYLIPWD